MVQQNISGVPYLLAHDSFVTRVIEVCLFSDINQVRGFLRSFVHLIFISIQETCGELYEHPIEERCEYVRNSEACNDLANTINYLEIFYCYNKRNNLYLSALIVSIMVNLKVSNTKPISRVKIKCYIFSEHRSYFPDSCAGFSPHGASHHFQIVSTNGIASANHFSD